MDNRWPKKKNENDDFKTHMIEFMEAANSLSARILNLIERETVPNVAAGTLARSHTIHDGLECCANPRGKSKLKKWIAVPPVEGGVVVNIGDMLARWSDGRLHSNLHRVRLPRKEEMNPPKACYSIGYFAQSDRNVVMESTNADPITAGDYIAMRIKANFP